jgi:chemotaxis protein methyltransferase CheR
MKKSESDSLMKDAPQNKAKLSDEQFKFLTQYLSNKYGLHIPASKKTLVESRLLSRLNFLGLRSIEDYIQHVFKSDRAGTEYREFVEKLTTHKTFFFRENHQFEFLKNLLTGYGPVKDNKTLHCWSAGCSTGEEVYTLGMVFNECKTSIPNLNYKITGTDIALPSLKKASTGVYDSYELDNVPGHIRDKYFAAVELDGRPMMQFRNPDVISRISLGVLNLNNKSYNLPHSFDFIFCRNVTIYFSPKTRSEVLARMVNKLKPGGYLFLGHSETALGMSLPLRCIQPTIYQKK